MFTVEVEPGCHFRLPRGDAWLMAKHCKDHSQQ